MEWSRPEPKRQAVCAVANPLKLEDYESQKPDTEPYTARLCGLWFSFDLIVTMP